VHVVVMGCGRVGSRLATSLDTLGHSVSVVDQNASAFTKLGVNFGGTTVKGLGFDRDHLRAAGIERADAFAAVSSGDNSNILAARVARETFGVQNVVARIYDPRRAEVYERLGIPTVASVAWQSERIMRRILPADPLEEWHGPLGVLAMLEMPYGDAWVGSRVTLLERTTGCRVAFLNRYGNPILPGEDTVIQADDGLHILVRQDNRDAVAIAIAAGPDKH
jgi:trk system potassium uptake protein TrkA